MTRETWLFDVDGCLVDSLTGASLRPGAGQILTHLRSRDLTVVLWSAGGAGYALQRAAWHGIAHLVDGFHSKDARDAAGRYVAAFLPAGSSPMFVDDRPEDMSLDANVIAVPPYIAPSIHDRGLARAATRAGVTHWRP